MICRMNKQQREAVIELIRAMIEGEIEDPSTDTERELKAVAMFHKLFANENPAEDNNNHVE